MKRYTYYLFDIDRTLWDFDTNAQNALNYTLDRFGFCARLGITDKKDFFDKYETVNQELWHRYERGEITKDLLRNERFYQTFKRFYQLDDRPLADEFGSAYLERMPLETALVPGAKQVLEELKRRGCAIATVSNGFKEVQYGKLENSGIMPYIDAVLISEEVGVHKPSPVIFRKALECLIGNGPSSSAPVITQDIKKETLMAGDDLANDIEGAQIYGIDQFYYNPHHYPCEYAPTYEGDDLLELIEN